MFVAVLSRTTVRLITICDPVGIKASVGLAVLLNSTCLLSPELISEPSGVVVPPFTRKAVLLR
jgi:hypothetical protein